MEILALAKHIFGGPPKQAGTIRLDISDCTPPNASPAFQAMVKSEILMLILLEGVQIRYGIQQSELSTITEEQIQEIAQYFRSIGYGFIVRTGQIDDAPPVPKTARETLKDFHERVYDFERGVWHEIFFEPLHIITLPEVASKGLKK